MDSTTMKTHFLKPFVTAIDGGGVGELPSERFSFSSSNIRGDVFSRISFSGFWSPDDTLKTWFKKMQALHEPIWRKAGIFEAIKASTYKIRKDQSLLLPLVENWCHTTKTFIFPWGEATITLEDVMVLLGFSVLGSSVFAPLESSEMRVSLENLQAETRELRVKDKDLRQVSWVSRFFGRGDQTEHEAFLVMWLSLFVFPGIARPGISKDVFPLAIRLARGDRVALAPAVLGKVYRDLSLIQASAREESSTGNVNLKSLFKLVQLWAWERFKNTRPTAVQIPIGEPRVAQWDNLDLPQRPENVCFDEFEWRPYTKPLPNWSPLRLYVEEAMVVTVENSIDDEFLSFARSVRSCKLVGIGIVEDYNPHRVARQFGMDQELPGLVSDRSSFTEQEAWEDYNKSLNGLELYMPSRLATGSVTERYQDWWLKSISKFLETFDARNRAVDEIENGGASASTQLPVSQLCNELAKGTSEDLSNKGCKRGREEDEGAMDYKDDEESDDNLTFALIKSTRNDESGSKAEKSMVLKPSDNESESNPEDFWRETAKKLEEIQERLQQRKLAIAEIASKLETGMARRNQMKNGNSAA
ncbi:putative serinePthreonine-protein phosphatase 7 long form [Cardamine amara subsp. amara]|uniref:SerinePthreonine-protein phosphatase 7 long form n=1 Tax=Cardamine amara subsp. amara TaxID=228776 RepID=A0ABD1BUM6_CARAN